MANAPQLHSRRVMIVATLQFTIGCLPADRSDLKSLDNFTASSVNQHLVSCIGDGPLHRRVPSNAPYARFLRAVPLVVQHDFFESYQGRIEVIDDMATGCQVPDATQGELGYLKNTRYSGCYRILPPSDPHGKSQFVMFVERSSMDKSLVRLFGLFASELVANRVLPQEPAQPAQLQTLDATDMIWDVAGVAMAFINDITNNTPGVRAQRVQALAENFPMSGELLNLVRNWQVGEPASMRAFSEYRGSDKSFFLQRVFAEAFDSWYCNQEATRHAQMRPHFGETYRAFAGIARDLDLASASTLVQAYGSEPARPINNSSYVTPPTIVDGQRGLSTRDAGGYYSQNLNALMDRQNAGMDRGQQAIHTAASRSGQGPTYLQGGGLGQMLQILMTLGRMLFSGGSIGSIGNVGNIGSNLPPTSTFPTTTTPPTVNNPLPTTTFPSTTTIPSSTSPGTTTPGSSSTSGFSQEVLRMTNGYRGEVGASQLQSDPALDEECRKQVEAQAQQCPTVSSFGQNCHCLVDNCNNHAENIGIGYGTAQAAAEGWRNSSGHYANMIKSSHRFHGAAEYKTHTCQRFR